VPAVAVGSANRALEELSLGGVTVIVADQRMPIMPGDALLGKVRDLYPHVARVLWTAYVTPDLIDNAPAYIVLSKGGEWWFVVDTIARLHRGAL